MHNGKPRNDVDTPAEQGRLVSAADWLNLAAGEHDLLRLEGFATDGECDALLDFVRSHTSTISYNTATGILRLGTSFSDIRKSDQLAAAYSTEDVLAEVVAINDVVPRLLGRIAATWPCGLETFVYRGHVLHRSIARRIVDAGAEPHDDDISKEVPEDATAQTVRVQFGVNLYLELPRSGGVLEGWRRRLASLEYDVARNPEPGRSYGVRRDVIGPPDWRFLPRRGDVVIFRNSEVHAITASSGARTTWGFFLGFRGPGRPLLMWS